MCAMMPMFRVFSRGYSASTARLLPNGGGGTQEKRGARSRPPLCISSLPAVMRERLVGLRHLVSVFSLLHGGPSVVGRVQQLAGQLVGHAALRASARRPDQPPHAQRGAPIRGALLAPVHHHVHELRHQPAPVLGVRKDLAPRGARPTHARRLPWAAWRRTSIGSAAARPPPRCPASRG